MRQSSPPITTRSGRRSVRILAQFLLILIIMSSSFTAAMAEEPASLEDAPEPAALEAVETPMPAPTPEPTPEPMATVEPTPTEVPTAEPTATVVPTVEPTEVVEPTPTVPAISASSEACNPQSEMGDFVGDPNPEYLRFLCTNVWAPGRYAVSVTAPSIGWSYGIDRIDGASWPRTGSTGPIEFDSSTPYNDFHVSFGRVSPTVTTCGEITVTVTSLDTGATRSTTLRARPHGVGWGNCQFEPAPPDEPEPVTASLVGGELPPVTFSFGERRIEGAMAIQVRNPSSTAGWTLDVSATELVYTGVVAGQGDWPASSLRVRVDGSTVSLSEASQQIVTIGGKAASYEYPVTLVIPGGSAVGTYSGTVTLTTTAAPGS